MDTDDIVNESYRNSICLIYKNNKIIGFTRSIHEADAICDKCLDIQWDFIKKSTNINKMELLTIHDF